MKTIHKYPLAVGGHSVIELPLGARILSAQVQNGLPSLWALVDTEYPRIATTIRIYGIGHEISGDLVDRLEYIDTFQLYAFALVFHVFKEVDHDTD